MKRGEVTLNPVKPRAVGREQEELGFVVFESALDGGHRMRGEAGADDEQPLFAPLVAAQVAEKGVEVAARA